MMKKIPLTSLKPGMIFSEPVYVDEDNVLVPADIAIREKDLRQLGSWGVKIVETDGVLVGPKPPPGTEASPAAQAPSVKTADPAVDIAALYADLVKRLNLLFANIAGGTAVDSKLVDNMVARLFQLFRNERKSIESFVLNGGGGGMAKTSINAAIFSIFIAQELKLPTQKTVRTAAAALFHDVGMFRLPKELMKKRGGFSAAEIRVMRSHPVYTHQILSREIGCPEETGRIALQHHERWDGQGYPGGIAGESIDLGARIFSVADAFEALVSKKPERNSASGYEALKILLSDSQGRFDPVVLGAFARTMGIYPVGSLVLLNNGAIGKVTELRAEAPLHPKILVLQDKEGNRQKSGKILDLATEKSLFIARALNKEYPKERA
jgi:HD-GYP domain-containing protein (c-di-GMP phosphodiesterase class II)